MLININLDPTTLAKLSVMRELGILPMANAETEDLIKYGIDLAYQEAVNCHNQGQEHENKPELQKLPYFEFPISKKLPLP